MPRLLDLRQEAFCRAYVRGPAAGMVCEAYELAGYVRDSGNASRLFRQRPIRERIHELRAGDAALQRQALRRALEDSKIDKLRIVQELSKLAFASAADYVDDKGCLDFKRIAQDTGSAVRDLAIDCVTAPDGKQKISKLRLRMNDKQKALMELAHQIDLTHEPPVPGIDDATPHTREYEQDIVIARMRDWTQEGRDVQGMVDVAVAAADTPSWEWHVHAQRMKEQLRPSIADLPVDNGEPSDVAPDDGVSDHVVLNDVARPSVARAEEKIRKPAAVVNRAAKKKPVRDATKSQRASRAVKRTPSPASNEAKASIAAQRGNAVAAVSSDQPDVNGAAPAADAHASSAQVVQPDMPRAGAEPSESATANENVSVMTHEFVTPTSPQSEGPSLLPPLDAIPPGCCPVCLSRTCSAGHSPAEWNARFGWKAA